jgi:hypothetical protein
MEGHVPLFGVVLPVYRRINGEVCTWIEAGRLLRPVLRRKASALVICRFRALQQCCAFAGLFFLLSSKAHTSRPIATCHCDDSALIFQCISKVGRGEAGAQVTLLTHLREESPRRGVRGVDLIPRR